MQVKNGVSNYIGKAFKLATLGLVGFVVVDNHKHTLINLERCKQEVYNTDSVRYNKLNETYLPSNRYSDYKIWCKERDEMYDSLRTIGQIKKSYFEGGQSLQDSVENVKVNKVEYELK